MLAGLSVPVWTRIVPAAWLSTPWKKEVVAAPAVFLSVPVLLNWAAPPRLFWKSASVWTSKTPLLLKVEMPERMSPVPAKFQVPWFSVTRPPFASFTLPPLRFIVALGPIRVVPVPDMFPPVQLEAGLGPLIVRVPAPARAPPDWSSCVVVATASKLAVPAVISVLVGL